MQDLTIFISQHLALTYTFALLLILLMVVEFLRLKRQSFRIDTTRAVQLINHDNAVVIDIRPNEAYQKAHIIDAISIPAKEMSHSPQKIEKYRASSLIIV